MTSVTEDTRCRVRPQRHDAISLDGKDRHEFKDHPAAVRHAHFHAVDRVAAQRFFASAYHPSWRISEFAKGSTITHHRCAAEHLTVDNVTIQGRVDCEIRTTDGFIVIQPRSGSLIAVGDGAPNADTPLLAVDGFPRLLRLNSVRFTVASIDADLLQQVAAGSHTPMPQQVEFLSSRPRTPAAARIWRDTFDYVTTSFASADTVRHPLLVTAAARLLAAALIECFPSNISAGQSAPNDPSVPKALQTAMSFIHRHAAMNIGVKDVAAVVHLTPRAVQYLFRQQLDTTPTEYLRRVRLHRAHQDLISGDRSVTTVSEIAQRWGFAHTGRFAVLYRQTYGESPHTALKRTAGG
ncbi:HTH-type transcriptional activator RhaS [Mycobacterium innocens]|uniref:HTH-type transcriptional activator RhaS n=1 Tax=Mycobacterium innocens TaxID=2341083 RepID=A0A498QGQ7_9MYCO|nr:MULTISPECIES: helix-turn-helix transcriptional regulator [Mycobacterium]VBA44461.1 HTH-type transcriptional activator RhaS [Mycobacterium innocens]